MSKVEKGDGEIIESFGVREEKPKMIADFNMARQTNPALTKCVWHTALSFPKGDSLDDSKMLAIAREWMNEMGLKHTQWVVIKHTDSGHPHLHVVATRIDDFGKTISDSNNWKRSQAICRMLEDKYGLEKLPEVRREQEINQEKLKGRDAFKSECHLAIQDVLKKAKSIDAFNLLMKEKKIDCLWRFNQDGTTRGLSFAQGEIKIKGSDINRIYSGRLIAAYLDRNRQKIERKTQQHLKEAHHHLKDVAYNFSDSLDSRQHSIDNDIIRIERVVNNPITKRLRYGR